MTNLRLLVLPVLILSIALPAYNAASRRPRSSANLLQPVSTAPRQMNNRPVNRGNIGSNGVNTSQNSRRPEVVWEREAGLSPAASYLPSTVFSLAPDGATLIRGIQQSSSHGNSQIELLDAATGKSKQKFDVGQRPLYSVAFGLKSYEIITGSDDTVRVWDSRTRKVLRTFGRQEDEPANGIALAPVLKLIAIGGHESWIRLYRFDSGRLRRELRYSEFGDTLAFSANGSTLASGSFSRKVHLWNTRNGQLMRVLEGPYQGALKIVFAQRADVVAAGCTDGAVRLWQLHPLKLLHTVKLGSSGIEAVALTDNGRMVAAGDGQGQVSLWEVPTGRNLRRWRGYSAAVSFLSFSSNRTRLIGADERGAVIAWYLTKT